MTNLLCEHINKQLQPIYDLLSDIPKPEMWEEGTALVIAFHNKGDMLFSSIGFPQGVSKCVQEIVKNTCDDFLKLIFDKDNKNKEED